MLSRTTGRPRKSHTYGIICRYLTTCAHREQYYSAIKDDPELHVKLSGSWEAVLGEQDTFSRHQLWLPIRCLF